MSDAVYRKIFDVEKSPGSSVEFEVPLPEQRHPRSEGPDVYRYDADTELGINVALATGRPLLVRGNPGCGKSSLASSVALRLGWRYFEQVVTSRTEARDLLWRFDALRRLAHSQAGGALAQQAQFSERYVHPGVLWWAYAPTTAADRGAPAPLSTDEQARPPGVISGRDPARAVVLIDEIDKAEPDVPNDLLEALGTRSFTVEETGTRVEAAVNPLIVVTTNGERQLPDAFRRRCVTLDLVVPDDLVPIGRLHFPDAPVEVLIQIHKHHRARSDEARLVARRAPSIAEYLDAVRACLTLIGTEGYEDGTWERVIRAALEKPEALRSESAEEDVLAP